MLTAADMECLQRLSPNRDQRLFNEFLPIGYGLITLNTVKDKEKVIEIKVILGSIITLFDDYADRPDRLNSKLLELMYRIPFQNVNVHPAFLSKEEHEALSLANNLFERLFTQMAELPNHSQLIDLFRFDLSQFFLANQYSEQLTKTPQLANQLENKLYLHHNMGIVMAGMIDLMSIESLDVDNLGVARELFLLGQRAGRISNIITTVEREIFEGDVTNEILCIKGTRDISYAKCKLEKELMDLINKISTFSACNAFRTDIYAKGLRGLYDLHTKLKGVI